MNYKRKSRRRFFLLVRSRTSPISSEFRGGGLNTPNPPSRYATDFVLSSITRICPVQQNGVFHNKLHIIFFLTHSYLIQQSTVNPLISPPSVAQIRHLWSFIYAWATDGHTRLRRYPIVSARRQHIVVLSPSVSEVPFETKSAVVSQAHRFAIVS